MLIIHFSLVISLLFRSWFSISPLSNKHNRRKKEFSKPYANTCIVMRRWQRHTRECENKRETMKNWKNTGMPVTDGKTIHHFHIICCVHDIIWHRQTQTSLNLPHQIFKINCAKMFAPFFTLVFRLLLSDAMPPTKEKKKIARTNMKIE